MKQIVLNISSIKESLIKKGLNQKDLASELDITPQAVSDWFKQKKLPTPKHLLRLSQILEISFNELVQTKTKNDIVFNYRLTQNKKLKEYHIEKANELSELLKYLYPFLNSLNPTAPPKLIDPKNDLDYYEKIAKKIRDNFKAENDTVSINSIINLFNELRSIIIPVLWGSKGQLSNALTISDLSEQISFVYVNLDSKVKDFKFWLLHEIAHILSPQLEGEDAEEFANNLARSILYPVGNAAEDFEFLNMYPNTDMKINYIIKQAGSHLISPITVYKQIQTYAKYRYNSSLNINEKQFYPILNKQKKMDRTVKDELFPNYIIQNPKPQDFIKTSSEIFSTEFYSALGSLIRDNDNFDVHYVRRLLNVSYEDAIGLYKALLNAE